MKSLLIVVLLAVIPGHDPVEVSMTLNDFTQWSCNRAIQEVVKRPWFANDEKVEIIRIECIDEDTVSN